MTRNPLPHIAREVACYEEPRCNVTMLVAVCVIAAWLTNCGALAQDGLPTRFIEGRVTNSDGKPIKGATVEWGYFLAEKEGREVFRTDADGKYRVETTKVGPDFRLGVSAIGFAPAWRDDLIPQLKGSATTSTFDFKLTSPISLRGKVVDENGKSIEGVRVIAQSPSTGFFSSFSMPTPSYPFPGPSREARTNSDGEFLIRYLPETPIIEKDAEKGHPFEVSIKTDTGTTPRGKAYAKLDNRIEIERSYIERSDEREGKIRGRVLDGSTELPIEKFKIVLRHRAGMREFASKDGEFLLDGLYVNYGVQFLVYAEDYAPLVLQPTTSGGDGTFVECQLKRKPGLKGIVVDNTGKPIPGAEIVLGFNDQPNKSNRFEWDSFKDIVDGYMGLTFVQRMITKDDGRFEFGLVDHQPIVAVIAPGFARQVQFFDRADAQTLHQSELRIELEPECSISGFAKVNGIPTPNAGLRLSSADWQMDFGTAKADEEGRFLIQNLSPGTYHLSVYQNSGFMSTSRLTKRVELKPNEVQANLVLDNPGGDSSLRGKSSPFAMILLTPKELEGSIESEYSSIGSVASPEGDFEIRGLHSGTYTYQIMPATSARGMISRGNRSEVVVSGDTVLPASENAPFPFSP